MSTTPLTDIQEIIERTVFENIRGELVDKGYLPDITLYDDDATGWAQWETDISSIVTSKGFAIEVYNVGASEAKGIKKFPRIVINAGSFLPGALGGDPQRFYSDQTTSYKSLVTPPQTADFYLDIHLASKTIQQARILNSLLSIAIPRRAYLAYHSDPNSSFFIRNIGYYDADDIDEGYMEKVFGYEIPDCWDAGDKDFDATIAKINEITLHPNIQKYMDRTWGHDADPLVVT